MSRRPTSTVFSSRRSTIAWSPDGGTSRRKSTEGNVLSATSEARHQEEGKEATEDVPASPLSGKKKKERLTSSKIKFNIDALVDEVEEEVKAQQKEIRAAQEENARLRAAFSAGASSGAGGNVLSSRDDGSDSEPGASDGVYESQIRQQQGHRELAAVILTTTMLTRCERAYNRDVRSHAQDGLKFRRCVDSLCPDLPDIEYRERLRRAMQFTFASGASAREGFMYTLELLHTMLKISLLEDGQHTQEEFETLAAFIQLGGGADKSGFVDAEVLRKSLKAFDMTVDVDAMIEEVDDDGSGVIEYCEFEQLYSGLREAAERENAALVAPVFCDETAGDGVEGELTVPEGAESGHHSHVAFSHRGTRIGLEPPSGSTDSIAFKLNQVFQAHRVNGKDLMRKTRTDNPEISEMFNSMFLVTMGGPGYGAKAHHGDSVSGSPTLFSGALGGSHRERSRRSSAASTVNHARSFSMVSSSDQSGQHNRSPAAETDLGATQREFILSTGSMSNSYCTPTRRQQPPKGGTPPKNQHTAPRRGYPGDGDRHSSASTSPQPKIEQPPPEDDAGELYSQIQAGSPNHYTPSRPTEQQPGEHGPLVKAKVSPLGLQDTYFKKDKALIELQHRRRALQGRLKQLREESELLQQEHSRQIHQQEEMKAARLRAEAEDRATRHHRAYQAIHQEQLEAAKRKPTKVDRKQHEEKKTIKAKQPQRPQSATSNRSNATASSAKSSATSYAPSGEAIPAPATTSYYLTKQQGDTAALTPRGVGSSAADQQVLRTPVQPTKTQYTPFYARIPKPKMVSPYQEYMPRRQLTGGSNSGSTGGGNFSPGGRIHKNRESTAQERKRAFFADSTKFTKIFRAEHSRLNIGNKEVITPRSSRRTVELVGAGALQDTEESAPPSRSRSREGSAENGSQPAGMAKAKKSRAAPVKPMDRWLQT